LCHTGAEFGHDVGAEEHDGLMPTGLHTSVDEIADNIFRFSTWVPDISEHGFTFNQFLLTGDQPFLFHCGMRQLFPLVSAAIAQVIPLEQLRWISFAHLEADECGAMNLLLAAAPHAEVIHSPLACLLSLNDLCDRPPVAVGPDAHDIGGQPIKLRDIFNSEIIMTIDFYDLPIVCAKEQT